VITLKEGIMTGLIVIAAAVVLFFIAPVSTIEWVGETIKEKARVWASLFPKKEEKND
jgi:hypothetical protein